MAYHETAQSLIECVPIGCKSIRVGKIDDCAFRLFIAGGCAAFRMLMYCVPVPIEIGSQRQQVGLALLAALGFLPGALFLFTFQSKFFRFLGKRAIQPLCVVWRAMILAIRFPLTKREISTSRDARPVAMRPATAG